MFFSISVCLALAVQGASPEEILATFAINPAFQIELVAMEPVVMDLVDLEFDEHGRAYVVEMPGYPFSDPGAPGRIVALEDTDGDGRFDRRTVFATDFPVADSLLPYEGGLLVASPPDLLFVKDTDGDGVAGKVMPDLREVLVSGFAVGNPQHNFNGLTHGLDNWVYGANGDNGGSIFWAGDDANRVSIARNDFRVHIPTKRIEAYGRTTGGFGIAFDDWGRMFGTHNLVHISHLVFPGRYIAGFPEHSLHENISDHSEGETARIFPIGVQETRVNHEEQSGYFSGACGIMYYGGGAFPENFNGNVFVCDVVLNLIHRDVISPDGASLRASRVDERVDFLASTDRAFRPVNLTVGPDGALYVVDMHRAVIEHPEWIPDEIEVKLDVNAGKAEGRLFRITPKGGLPKRTPNFDRNDLRAVVASLADANKWWRDTAQRLLVQWNATDAAPELEQMAREHESPVARLHALWTLQGLDALGDETLLRTLADANAGLRENAVQIAEARLANSDKLRSTVRNMSGDADARVRMYVALALSTLDSPDIAGLSAIAHRDIEDRWTRLALLAGFGKQPGNSLTALLKDESIRDLDAAAELLSNLARLTGNEASQREIQSVVEAASGDELAESTRVALLVGLVAGLETPKDASKINLDSLLDADSPRLQLAAGNVAVRLEQEFPPQFRERIGRAGVVALDAAASKETRLENLALLELAPYEERADTLFTLLDKSHPAEIQRAAIEQLQRVRKPEVAQRLIDRWDTLGRNVLPVAGDILLYQRDNHDVLLTALESGKISLGQMDFHLERRRVLLRSRDESIKKRAEALFTDAGVVTRGEAIERMRPALALSGDPANGKTVFTELCAKCHEISGEGVSLGPSLTDIFRKSPETLLHDILDPNAGVNPEYISYAIETTDGAFYSGIVAAETDDAVTLREAEGKETVVPRDKIKEMFSGGLSIMPEELEVDMAPQTMADLLAYLLQPR